MALLSSDEPDRLGRYLVVSRVDAGVHGFDATERRFIARPDDGVDGTFVVTTPLQGKASDAGYAERFRAESERIRDMGQVPPGIEPVDDVSPPGNPLVWHAAPYVPAIPLPVALRASDGLLLPEGAVRAIGAILAEALTRLHTRRIAHAGISPSSVLLKGDGVVLTGFGAVRAAGPDGEPRAGLPGMVAATTATEQLQGGRPRPPGDVFALGSVLAYAATGTLTPEKTEIPAGLRTVVTACCARDAAERPTAAELLAELARGREASVGALRVAERTVLDGVATSSTREPGRAPTVLDAGAVQATDTFESGRRLPGNVIAALAEQAAEALNAELESVDGPHAPFASGADTEPSTSDGPAAPDASWAGAAPSTPPRHDNEDRWSRRSVLTAAAAAVMGSALGFGGVTAVGRADDRRAARDRGKIHGTPPPVLWTHALKEDSGSVGLSVWRNEVAIAPDLTGVVGIDMSSGERLWSATETFVTARSLDVGEDLLLVPGVSTISFLSARTGALRWRADEYEGGTGKDELEHVLGADGGVAWLIVTREDTQFLVAYDVGDRREKWREELPSGAFSREIGTIASRAAQLFPSGSNLILVQGEEPGFQDPDALGKKKKQFVAVDRRSGRRLWSKTYATVSQSATVTPLSRGRVLASSEGTLRAINLQNGTEEWRYDIASEAASFGIPAVHGGIAYAADALSAVSAVRAKTGKALWHRDPQILLQEEVLGTDVRTHVSPTGRTVLVTNSSETLAYRARDGKVMWRFADVSGVAEAFGAAGLHVTFGDEVAVITHKKSVYALPTA